MIVFYLIIESKIGQGKERERERDINNNRQYFCVRYDGAHQVMYHQILSSLL